MENNLNIKEIKVLEYLKNSNGVHFTKASTDDMNYFEVSAIARDLQKKGFASNNNGILNITEQGEEYLKNSN